MSEYERDAGPADEEPGLTEEEAELEIFLDVLRRANRERASHRWEEIKAGAEQVINGLLDMGFALWAIDRAILLLQEHLVYDLRRRPRWASDYSTEASDGE
jgi:hypothetical protein